MLEIGRVRVSCKNFFYFLGGWRMCYSLLEGRVW